MAYIPSPIPGTNVQSKIIGVDASLRWLKRHGEKFEKGCERGVFFATENIRKKSVVVCPKDTGALADSARTWYTGKGANRKGAVTFGDNETKYAIYVHEDLTKYHKPGTYAKFLSRTVYETRKETSLIIKNEIEKEIRR